MHNGKIEATTSGLGFSGVSPQNRSPKPYTLTESGLHCLGGHKWTVWKETNLHLRSIPHSNSPGIWSHYGVHIDAVVFCGHHYWVAD